MPIDEYRHLWDGSEPGWTLHRVEHIAWSVSFSFSETGPTPSEIVALRKLLDEFRNSSMPAVLQQLRGQSTYMMPYELGNIEMRQLVDSARELGLEVKAESIDRGGYLPVSSEGHALIIEDDDISAQVKERMIAAGVPITDVHVD